MSLASRSISTGSGPSTPSGPVVELAADGSVPPSFAAAARAAAAADVLLRTRLPHPQPVGEWPSPVVAEVHLRAVATAAVKSALAAAGVSPRWSLEVGQS